MRSGIAPALLLLALASGSAPVPADQQPRQSSLQLARQQLIADLNERVQAESERLAALEAEMQGVVDPAVAERIQSEIHAVKLATEKLLLQLQLDFARQRGDVELAGRLEQALRRLEKPADTHSKIELPERR